MTVEIESVALAPTTARDLHITITITADDESGPQAVPYVRHMICALVQGRSFSADALGACVTEVATNSIDHTDSEEISITTILNDHVIRVEVTDAGSSTEPHLRQDVGDYDLNGRGLILVNAFSSGRWGTRPAPNGHGRVTWFELEANSPHGEVATR